MVALINNHVLFPELANWAQLPDWKRTWQNDVSLAVTGDESRQGMRAHPRVSLGWTITPQSLPDLGRFDDRVRAAKKSGKACTAYAGRGYVLQSMVDDDIATLDRDFNTALGNYLFFLDAVGNYEVRTVLSSIGPAVTLDQAVARTYRANTFCWPMIFGRFSCEDLAARSPRFGSLRVNIQELVSPATVQLGALVPIAGVGIGVMVVNTTFTIAQNYVAGVAGETLTGVAGENINPIN